MTAPAVIAPPIETLADLLDRLGDIPLERIRFRPYLEPARAGQIPGRTELIRMAQSEPRR